MSSIDSISCANYEEGELNRRSGSDSRVNVFVCNYFLHVEYGTRLNTVHPTCINNIWSHFPLMGSAAATEIRTAGGKIEADTSMKFTACVELGATADGSIPELISHCIAEGGSAYAQARQDFIKKEAAASGAKAARLAKLRSEIETLKKIPTFTFAGESASVFSDENGKTLIHKIVSITDVDLGMSGLNPMAKAVNRKDEILITAIGTNSSLYFILLSGDGKVIRT